MQFHGRDVVLTGGTGALGAAVVGGLVGAGAMRTVPWLLEKEAEHFPYRERKQVTLVGRSILLTRLRSAGCLLAFQRYGHRFTSPAGLPWGLWPRPARPN
jgi:NAD(P)-dependent dehydrogenase (short-subunit alcohol dehydrogenase family)